MKQDTAANPEAQESTASREPLKHAPLAFAGIWIIIVTCTLTNLFVLRNPVLMLTVIPIAAFVFAAHARTAAALAADRKKARIRDNG
jgi:hypothetical protein